MRSVDPSAQVCSAYVRGLRSKTRCEASKNRRPLLRKPSGAKVFGEYKLTSYPSAQLPRPSVDPPGRRGLCYANLGEGGVLRIRQTTVGPEGGAQQLLNLDCAVITEIKKTRTSYKNYQYNWDLRIVHYATRLLGPRVPFAPSGAFTESLHSCFASVGSITPLCCAPCKHLLRKPRPRFA
jgi:hypothetical protein